MLFIKKNSSFDELQLVIKDIKIITTPILAILSIMVLVF